MHYMIEEMARKLKILSDTKKNLNKKKKIKKNDIDR